MGAGQLRHIVTIQRQKQATGGMLEPVRTWEDVATNVRAGIEPLNGKEYLSARQTQGEVSVRIRMWYRDGIESSMRVVHGSEIYNIVSVIDPDKRHRKLILMCTQGSEGDGA